ncbi:MAG: nucleotidyltransferase domain-containing protein [archaeon]
MIRKNIKLIIIEYFFENPTVQLRVREIERRLKLPLPSVIRYCRELEEETLLTKKTIGNIHLYAADRTSEKYLLEKKLHNLRQIYESGVTGYLKQELSNPAVILFGSYLRGEDIEVSDIDLYIETSSNAEIDLKKYELILKRKIQTIKCRKLSELSNPHLANSIINGAILTGYIEVFK